MINRIASRVTANYVLPGVLFLLLSSSGTASADEFLTLQNCTFIETAWHDGDSFLVQDQTGKRFTIRLCCVDCLEYHVHDTTDARRLRTQRRYFGIANHGGSAESSIAVAKKLGQAAAAAFKQELKEPCTVHTAIPIFSNLPRPT